MNELIQQIEGAIKKAREVANEGAANFGASATSVRKAKVALAQAHLEQALRVLEEN